MVGHARSSSGGQKVRRRFLQRAIAEAEEHDVSKELFLGIMMLMLCLGIMILNSALPSHRLYRYGPKPGDVVIIYTSKGPGFSEDGRSVKRTLRQDEFIEIVNVKLFNLVGIELNNHFYNYII